MEDLFQHVAKLTVCRLVLPPTFCTKLYDPPDYDTIPGWTGLPPRCRDCVSNRCPSLIPSLCQYQILNIRTTTETNSQERFCTVYDSRRAHVDLYVELHL